MKMFEQTEKPRDAAIVISELFNHYEEVPAGPVSCFISPSGLGCQAGIAFKLQGAPTTPQKESFQSRSFADAGTDRHERIQEFLSNSPYWVDIEEYIKLKKLDDLEVVRRDGYEVLLVSRKYQARFKLDGMLLIDGHYYVLEIKTERQAANSTRTGPADKHQKQGISYTLMLQTDRILWVYEGRDFLEQKPFVQYVTKEEKAQLEKYIITAIENKDTPEKLERDTKGCPYCSFKNYCKMYFREYEKKVKLWKKE